MKNTPEPDPTGPAAGRASWVMRLTGHFLDLAGALALGVLLTITVSDALLRSVFNRPVFGAGDMVQVALATVISVALPLSFFAGRAIAIEILTERLPPRAHRGLAMGVSSICALACGLVSWRCYINAKEAARFAETTMLLQIPYGPFYGLLSLSFALSAVVFAVRSVPTKVRP